MNIFPTSTPNPFPAYDRARAAFPLLHVPNPDLWMIFDYDGVKRTITDYEALQFQPGEGK